MEDFEEYVKGFDEENKPFDVIELKRQFEELKQKSQLKKVSISKPKGDVEMKNITYRAREKRYIGRKQIFGNIITVYAKTQKDCLMKLNEKIREKKEEFTTKKEICQYTVKRYWEKWYVENKEPFIAESTKEDFIYIKKKIEPIFNINLRKLSKEIILKHIATSKESRTSEKAIIYLREMLDCAVKEHKIKFNPFDTIVVKFKKRKPKPPFTYEEQKVIIESLRGKEFEPIILLYLTTGLRKNELDFKDIEKHIDENNVLTARNLKSRDKEIRYKKIKISKDMAEIVFKNKEVFHKYNARLIFDHFDSFLKELKIKGSIVTCRHTFATNCFYLEKDSLIIAREMGHISSDVTKENYINIDYNLSKEKILKLYNNLYNLN